jgi:hypothetical protein
VQQEVASKSEFFDTEFAIVFSYFSSEKPSKNEKVSWSIWLFLDGLRILGVNSILSIILCKFYNPL